MITKEELETLVNGIKDKMDETSSALASEDFLSVISNYTLALDTINELNEKLDRITQDKEELLKANGKLFQKIGFDKEEEKEETKKNDEDEIKIEDIIDEKGDFKDE